MENLNTAATAGNVRNDRNICYMTMYANSG